MLFRSSFFLVPKIISNLSAAAYGFINLSNDFVNYASLITVALNSIAGRYITLAIHKNKYKEANKYFNSVIISNIIMSVILVLPMTLFVIFIDTFLNIPIDLVTDIRILFIIVFTNFILSLLTSVFSSTTFVTNKLYLSSMASIASQLTRCFVLLILFSLFNTNVWFVGIASLVSIIIVTVANYFFTKKLLPKIKINLKEFDLSCVIEMFKNGIWNSVNKLSGILQTGLDLLLSNIFINAAAMGIIALPRTITSIIFSMFGSISSIFNPNIMQAYAKNDMDSIKKQLNFAIKFNATLSNACIATFIILGLNFFKLWVPSQDANFLYFLGIISMCSLTLSIPIEPVYCVHISANQIKKPAIVGLILSCITIALVILGVSITNDEILKIVIIYGTSTLTDLFRIAVFIPQYTAKVMGENKFFLYPYMLKNVIIVVLTSLIGIYFRKSLIITNWFTFFFIATIIGIILILFIFLLNFNSSEKNEFYKLIT